MYAYFGAMTLMSLVSMYYQWKAQQYGNLEALYHILAMGTGPTKRKREEDIDTDKEM
jgi:hypothetical protein